MVLSTRQHALTSSKTKSKIGRVSLIREALSASAADKPPRTGGGEAPFEAMLLHTAASRSQTLLSTHTIDTVAVATASQGNFSAKLLAFHQGYLQITT